MRALPNFRHGCRIFAGKGMEQSQQEVLRMDVLTTSEAVRQFQMHPATVQRLILTCRVAAQKDVNGRWLIKRSDLETWSRQRVRKAPNQSRQRVPSGVSA
jgi:Helix-turn-helix domain